MLREEIQKFTGRIQHGLVPFQRTADAEQMQVGIPLLDDAGPLAELCRISRIGLGRVLAPGAVVFVADTPVFDPVGGCMAVMCPKFAEIRRRVAIDVLNPFQSFPKRTREFGVVAHIEVDIRLGAYFAAPRQEFVGSELVVLNPAPMVVRYGWPERLGANTVSPPVLVNDRTPRPAHHRYLKVAKTRSEVVAYIALKVGNAAIDHAVIDVLQHLPVYHRVDLNRRRAAIDFNGGDLGTDLLGIPHQDDEGKESGFAHESVHCCCVKLYESYLYISMPEPIG